MRIHAREHSRKCIRAFCEGGWRFLVQVLSGVLLLAASQGRGQSYTLDWWDVSAGGTSTGGVYTLSGSIGQPDAGSLSAGQYTLTGGFWAPEGLTQEPVAPPILTITITETNRVLLNWPSQATGFVVQQIGDLDRAWSDAEITPTDNGVVFSVLLPSNPGTRFYRLKK